MFKKVLVSEDHETANLSVQNTLKDLEVENIDYVYYCDDAYNRIKSSLNTDTPYDLLITDLYYEEDHHKQKIQSGFELIEEVRKIHPTIKILVFSSEHRPIMVQKVMQQLKANGYVRKARRDAQVLKQALLAIANDKKFVSEDLSRHLHPNNNYEFTALDVEILNHLAEGTLQKDIPSRLKEKKINPHSLSSVEKRIARMKEELGIQTKEQLIAYSKDIGII